MDEKSEKNTHISQEWFLFCRTEEWLEILDVAIGYWCELYRWCDGLALVSDGIHLPAHNLRRGDKIYCKPTNTGWLNLAIRLGQLF